METAHSPHLGPRLGGGGSLAGSPSRTLRGPRRLPVLCVDQEVHAPRAIAASASRLAEALLDARRLTLAAGPAALAVSAVSASWLDLVFADPPYRFHAFYRTMV
jgi:16S rRNA G966 N2-methylase RsmD